MNARRLSPAAAAALLILCGGPAVAGAQQIDSPYDFIETSHGARGIVGYVLPSGGVLDLGPQSGPVFGLGYNLRVSGPFNIDARALYFPTSRTVYDDTAVLADSTEVRDDPMFGLEPLGESDFDLLMLDASLRFDITGPRTFYRMQPYATIGAGGVFRLTDESDVPAEETLDDDLRARFRNGFTGHVGAGVEGYLTQSLTVRVDVRDVLWKLQVPEGFFEPGRILDSESWVQNAVFGLGVVYRF